MNSRLYLGELMHARLHPVEHAFAYRSITFVFDLDELPRLSQQIRGFGYNRFAPVALHDRDYLHAGSEPIREKLGRYWNHAANGVSIERVELVTCPRLFHYVFNPVSFYYGYGADGTLVAAIAEVNNTFRERHVYVLSEPQHDEASGAIRFQHEKEFHVSPMNDMRGRYTFRFSPLAEEMAIGLDLIRDEQTVLTAALSGRRRVLTTKSLWQGLLLRPVSIALTVPRIVWQAAVLHYGKRLPIYRRPVPTHPMTILRRPGENEVRAPAG